uniref:1-acylglycerol-3-phosphate O-acyltransferase n=1 Tax=Malurus cyaneus samueli TaxID=2593467 RepID=A0A8C5U8J9_9PASS
WFAQSGTLNSKQPELIFCGAHLIRDIQPRGVPLPSSFLLCFSCCQAIPRGWGDANGCCPSSAMVEVIPERCVPIAKRELLYLGTVGWACWLSGIIFIDRHRRDAAIEVISRTASLRVWVFPEGTRNPGKAMLPFKRGAFHLAVQAQVPIVPIVVSPYRDFFSAREKRFTAGTDGRSARVGPGLAGEGLPRDVPKLTESVRQAMAEALAEMATSDRGTGTRRRGLAGTRGTGTGGTRPGAAARQRERVPRGLRGRVPCPLRRGPAAPPPPRLDGALRGAEQGRTGIGQRPQNGAR